MTTTTDSKSNTGYRLRALADWCEKQHTSPTPTDLRALAAMADLEMAGPDDDGWSGTR